MHAKTAIIAGTFVIAYLAVVLRVAHGWAAAFAVAVFHYAMFQSTIGIAHDATHGAYSRNQKTNARISKVFDVLGIDSRLWIDSHVKLHHAAPNVPSWDSAIESFALVRLHPGAPWRPWHRVQHVTMFVVYLLVTIFQVYVLEILALAQSVEGYREAGPRLVRIVAKKGAMLGVSILAPLALADATAGQVIAGALVGHALCGLTIGLVFQTTHLTTGTTFRDPDGDGFLDGSYAEHLIATTADFAASSPVITWIAGGLNLHVAHHFFPQVSQTHLPALTRIVRDTALELGVPYRSFTFGEAIRGHFRLLRELGRPIRTVPRPMVQAVVQ